MSSKNVKKYIIRNVGKVLKDALITLTVTIAADSLKTIIEKNKK